MATEEFESVAVGAARQAAWALTGDLPEWPVPVAGEFDPSPDDVAAARQIADRYGSVLTAHFGVGR